MSKVYVFLADGFEEIEGLTVVDLLRRANIETEMVSVMEGKQIKGSHGIKVTADSMFADVDFSDIEILPNVDQADVFACDRAHFFLHAAPCAFGGVDGKVVFSGEDSGGVCVVGMLVRDQDGL